MRSILILLTVAFGVMLIVFPVMMQIAGVGTGGTIGVALLIMFVAMLCLGILRAWSGTFGENQVVLHEGDAWAAWQLTTYEQRRFLDAERGHTRRKAAAYAVGGTAIGLVLALIADDWLLGGILIGVFLSVAVVVLTMAGPPRDAESDAGREVRLNSHGVQALDRYIPLQGPMLRVCSVEMQAGDPAVLRFDVHSGRRVEEMRVPVPRDRVAEAEALVERLRRELDLAGL
jgi:hypothetical protein